MQYPFAMVPTVGKEVTGKRIKTVTAEKLLLVKFHHGATVIFT